MLLHSSAYNLRKRNSNVSKFVSWLSSSLYFGDSVRYINVNFKFHCFSAYCFSTTLNKADLILATSSKLLLKSNYLKAIMERLSFQIYLCQRQVKLLALSSYTTFDWKYQRCEVVCFRGTWGSFYLWLFWFLIVLKMRTYNSHIFLPVPTIFTWSLFILKINHIYNHP